MDLSQHSAAGGFPILDYLTEEQVVGEGGMSTVYLALHKHREQHVAVKVLHAPPDDNHDLKARFLEGCEILSGLNHPNVVNAIDYGTWRGDVFLVMDYLPGGDLNQRIGNGMHIQALVKVVKDVGRALDYVHQAGVVHGDVKPENVMFNASGSAILTDFDIARRFMRGTSNLSHLTARGTVLGTPEYISPEQAAGRAMDGRSDIYSLGVVLFRMLSGQLPYRADTAVELGVKHLQEPIPRLPAYVNMFQEVIDKALAKRPEQRYATGSELVKALDGVRATVAIPDATLRTSAISTQEIRAVGGDLLNSPMDPARQERQYRRRRRRRVARRFSWALVLTALLGGGGYYVFSSGLVEPDRLLTQLGITEDPRVAAAWNEARSLRQDPNQGLAAIVAAYRRVLAVSPDHERAQQALASLAADWQTSIDQALSKGNLQLAETRLAEAGSAFPSDPEWARLNARLQNWQRAQRLMVSTQALLTSHGLSDLPSATAAIQSYQEVLRLAPTHAGAQRALQELAVHYAAMATQAARDGEVSQAISLLERATAADARLPALDDVRKLISQATTSQSAIAELLQQARRLRAENQLILPAGANAAELYHRVLATDPDNVIAVQGLNEITSQVAATADGLLAQGQLGQVDSLISQATAAGLNADNINELRRRLDIERSRQENILENLQAATVLFEQGFVTAPPEDNAVARLRAIQQIDPGNPQANLLLRQSAERLVAVARDAYQYGMKPQAKQYLDLALTITPEVEEWVSLRDSWESE